MHALVNASSRTRSKRTLNEYVMKKKFFISCLLISCFSPSVVRPFGSISSKSLHSLIYKINHPSTRSSNKLKSFKPFVVFLLVKQLINIIFGRKNQEKIMQKKHEKKGKIDGTLKLLQDNFVKKTKK